MEVVGKVGIVGAADGNVAVIGKLGRLFVEGWCSEWRRLSVCSLKVISYSKITVTDVSKYNYIVGSVIGGHKDKHETHNGCTRYFSILYKLRFSFALQCGISFAFT